MLRFYFAPGFDGAIRQTDAPINLANHGGGAMTVSITESSKPGRSGKPCRFPRKSANAAQRAFNNGFATRAKKRRPARQRLFVEPIVETKPAAGMVSDELSESLASLHLSRGALARALGCHARTVRHWTQDRPVPIGIAVLVRMLVRGRIAIDDIVHNREPEQRTTAERVFALRSRQCRWPVGDPQRPGFKFCCAETIEGRTYCAVHFAAAHRAS